jgi:hypothetical protein
MMHQSSSEVLVPGESALQPRHIQAETSRKPQTDLDSRLRNLEHLISSIPAGSGQGSAPLSSEELDQVRLAAHFSPDSDFSTPDALGKTRRTDSDWMMEMYGSGTSASAAGLDGSLNFAQLKSPAEPLGSCSDDPMASIFDFSGAKDAGRMSNMDLAMGFPLGEAASTSRAAPAGTSSAGYGGDMLYRYVNSGVIVDG